MLPWATCDLDREQEGPDPPGQGHAVGDEGIVDQDLESLAGAFGVVHGLMVHGHRSPTVDDLDGRHATNPRALPREAMEATLRALCARILTEGTVDVPDAAGRVWRASPWDVAVLYRETPEVVVETSDAYESAREVMARVEGTASPLVTRGHAASRERQLPSS